MKKLLFGSFTLCLIFALFLSQGCKYSGKRHAVSDSSYPTAATERLAATATEGEAAPAGIESAAEIQRKLIWTADMAMEVKDLKTAVNQAVDLTQKSGGYVENKAESGDHTASLTLRVPVTVFNNVVTSLEGLGELQNRQISGEDVTEQYVDLEARLKNKIVLRDRLQQLLTHAGSIQDMLSVENELNRVQSEIDSMEGRLRALKGMVDYATINLRLQQHYEQPAPKKKILGPLGLLIKGIGWSIEKLFVIREGN